MFLPTEQLYLPPPLRTLKCLQVNLFHHPINKPISALTEICDVMRRNRLDWMLADNTNSVQNIPLSSKS